MLRESELTELLRARAPVTVLDVRWALHTGADRAAYLAGHVPGAQFVDLDADLADPPGAGGRHPLPSADRFAAAMRRCGVDNAHPVVVYDDSGGLSAARAWWLLRHHGHDDVRVLDGGWSAWEAAGHPVETGTVRSPPGRFRATPGRLPTLSADDAEALARTGVLLDVRAPERYRGETEPVDRVAGHIPGALNLPTTGNVDDDGRFLSPPRLRDRFAGVADRAVGVYCGSGVTAAHTVLALEVAGIPASLYPGSWSGWITDPRRPVVTGAAPG
ncbi:MAG: sulfurtransferase [Actinomycetota bacterium]|nr:sulfurtransferase [Actinomycetota bacterium]